MLGRLSASGFSVRYILTHIFNLGFSLSCSTKYILLTIASIVGRLIMQKKTRAKAKGMAGHYADNITLSQTKNKRKLHDEDNTNTEANHVNIDSGDEHSGVQKS